MNGTIKVLNLLNHWKGSIEVNGIEYESIQNAIVDFKTFSNNVSIILHTNNKTIVESQPEALNINSEYVVTVKQYMTRKSTPEFDFMLKWNNDNPMPLRTMVGTVEKETKGMVYMKLRGDIIANQVFSCMCCGRKITNPVSQYFGMGPECGGHNYVSPFEDDAELKEAVNNYKKQLQNIRWDGWIIKSAITESKEFRYE